MKTGSLSPYLARLQGLGSPSGGRRGFAGVHPASHRSPRDGATSAAGRAPGVVPRKEMLFLIFVTIVYIIYCEFACVLSSSTAIRNFSFSVDSVHSSATYKCLFT